MCTQSQSLHEDAGHDPTTPSARNSHVAHNLRARTHIANGKREGTTVADISAEVVLTISRGSGFIVVSASFRRVSRSHSHSRRSIERGVHVVFRLCNRAVRAAPNWPVNFRMSLRPFVIMINTRGCPFSLYSPPLSLRLAPCVASTFFPEMIARSPSPVAQCNYNAAHHLGRARRELLPFR